MHFPGYVAIVPTLGAALLIYSGHLYNQTAIIKILSTRLFVGIGLISYSLYLWHWPILAFWHYYNPGVVVSVQTGLMILIMTLLLSALSYTLIELPLKKKTYKFNAAFLKWHLIPLIPIIVISIISINLTHGLPSRMGKQLYLESKFVDKKYCHGGITGDCVAGDLDSKLPAKTFLFGDSHGGVFSPFWDEVAKSYGFKIKFYTNAGCYPLLDTVDHIPSDSTKILISDNQHNADICAKQISYVSQNYNNYDLFIIIASWDGYYIDRGLPFNFESEFANTIKFLVSHGKRVIVMGDTPRFLNDEGISILRHDMLSQSLWFKPEKKLSGNLTAIESDNDLYNSRVVNLVNNYPQVYYFDTVGLLIKPLSNFPYVGDFLLYKDNDHLNQEGSRILAQRYLSSANSKELKKLFESAGIIISK